MSDKPLFFISHKHTDALTASAVKAWVERWSQKRVAVFQSSAMGEGLRIGEELNAALFEKLHRASVIFLIYTTADQDWSYCMWECGVSMGTQTRVIVLQCARDRPLPFSGRVRVELGSDKSVHDFVRDFLTIPDFFHSGEAVAPHFEKTDIEKAAKDFLASVRPTLPDFEWQGSQEWPALPFLRLELDLDEATRIKETDGGERPGRCREALEHACIVRMIDWVAASLFGFVQVANERPFASLLKSWREKTPVDNADWIDIMARQMSEAICDQFPPYEWKLMTAVDGRLFTPMINWVRRIIPERCIQFDFYFLPMEKARKGNEIRIPVPQK